MKVIVSPAELLNRGIWLKAAEVLGIREAVNAGRVKGDTPLELTGEQAREIGLLAVNAVPAARWTALKDYLTGCIEADEAVRQGLVADGETEKAAPFGGLVSANRSTLKKMRELEQS